MQEVIFVIVAVVSVISWIIRKMKGDNGPVQQPVPRPGRPRAQRVDDEIEAFLKQQGGGKRQERQAEPARPQQQRQQPQRPRPPGKSGQPAVSKTPPPRAPQPPPVASPNVADRPNVISGDIGGGLRDHLKDYMTERIAQEARQDVGEGVRASVQQHLGQAGTPWRTPEAPAPAKQPGPPSQARVSTCCNIRRDLINAENIRRAILVQEVLNPPRSRRRYQKPE